MKFAMCLETSVGPKWVHARQLGVDHAVVLGSTDGAMRLHEYGNLLMLKKQFEDAGLNLSAIEGLVPMDEMKAGTAGSTQLFRSISGIAEQAERIFRWSLMEGFAAVPRRFLGKAGSAAPF